MRTGEISNVRMRALICCGFAVSIAGCALRVNVKVDSEPPGAQVFLIPRFIWETHGRTEMLKDADALERYRVGGTQVTPFAAPVGYQEQVLVMKFGNRFERMEVTPNEGNTLFMRTSPEEK